MQCPKCAGTMERITHLAWHVHRCTECKGLWFDMGEYEHLKGYAEEIDTGDARRGEATMRSTISTARSARANGR